MAVRVGINGFGRIGRLALRAMRERHPSAIEVVAINDIADLATNAHLLKHDTNYGKYPGTVEARDGKLVVDGHAIMVFSEREPSAIPWGNAGAELVVESTGRFTAADKARGHLQGGAKKVVISAPARGEDGSCTTNGLSVTAKVLSRQFGIKRGLMTTVHSYTNTQRVLDVVSDDLREARAAAENIIPASTGAAKAIFLVLPELKGKLTGIALRVPTPTVSIVDLTVELEKPATVEEINAAYKKAADGEMKGYLGFSEEPLVSMDFRGDSRSGIVDGPLTMAIDEMAKVMAWYDNEWGYACRIADLTHYMAQRGV
jgi:glyceraldehyde 3-phosphate dehydrogenase